MNLVSVTETRANLPYSDVLELTDIIDELSDSENVSTIAAGRKQIREGAEGIPVANLFDRIRSK